jgi:hypothetical protein
MKVEKENESKERLPLLHPISGKGRKQCAIASHKHSFICITHIAQKSVVKVFDIPKL